MRHIKRALSFSALFCALIPANGSAQDCPPHQITETAKVRHVYDGDTLWLADGRKIRLIGINTPEMARENRPAEPFAIDAKNALIMLLKTRNNLVGLSYGPEREDKYQRTLAHLYLTDGRSIQAQLLRAGLATAYTTPPNDTKSQCYRRAESVARKQKSGLWSLDAYQPKTTYQLKPDERGFRLINTTVTDVRFTKKAVWIESGNKFEIRIRNRDLKYFNLHQLRTLKGKNIQTRGWIHPKKNKHFMALRHSDALIIK